MKFKNGWIGTDDDKLIVHLDKNGYLDVASKKVLNDDYDRVMVRLEDLELLIKKAKEALK